MSLIDRILRVIRANFNSLVSNAEDPEKILEQNMMEMQEYLIQLRQAIAAAIANRRRTERHANQAQSHSEEWYRRAKLAVNQGSENLAREALTKRKEYQEATTTLLKQVDEQNEVVAMLRNNMRALELKISDMKTRKDMFIARIRSAETSAKLQEILNGVREIGSLSAFEWMEDKILHLESQQEVMPVSSTKIDTLEDSSNINGELANIKMQPKYIGHPESKQLPKNNN
ncbi:Phage shock protein A [Richelia intracellularis HM01]|uniref:PspA/IM30 family protein n=1 Tax=Richelia intracellularis TaxID=1164990 RepID=UPI0002B50F7D|nr:PspA/IM30 family protein [Richelia intracellularis]CCH64514.1 Phage shock protein A [Richelia intracellularis HM01]